METRRRAIILKHDELMVSDMEKALEEHESYYDKLERLHQKIFEDRSEMKKKRLVLKKKAVLGRTHITETKWKRLDSWSPQYKITLKFLNAILRLSNKDTIKEIEKFKIDKDSLNQKECLELLDIYLPDIIKHFGKKKINLRGRDHIENYIITVIRNIAKHCGYRFKSDYSIKHVNLGNNIFRRDYFTFFSIIE